MIIGNKTLVLFFSKSVDFFSKKSSLVPWSRYKKSEIIFEIFFISEQEETNYIFFLILKFIFLINIFNSINFIGYAINKIKFFMLKCYFFSQLKHKFWYLKFIKLLLLTLKI